MHWSCKRGYRDLTSLLLSSAANPNAEDMYEYTPLDYACLNKDIKMAKELLLYKAKPFLKSLRQIPRKKQDPEMRKLLDQIKYVRVDEVNYDLDLDFEHLQQEFEPRGVQGQAHQGCDFEEQGCDFSK